MILTQFPSSIEYYVQTQLSGIIAIGEDAKRWQLSNNGCHKYQYLFTIHDRTRTSFYVCLWTDENDSHPYSLNFKANWNKRTANIDRHIQPYPSWRQEEHGLIILMSACSTNQYFFYLNTLKLRELIIEPGREYYWPAHQLL